MPVDKDGIELKLGDIVTIRCKVVNMQPTDENNNIALQTLEELFPSNSYSTIILNSKQIQRVGQ